MCGVCEVCVLVGEARTRDMSEAAPQPPTTPRTHQPARMLRACAYATMPGMLGNRVWFTMGSPLALWKPMPPGPELHVTHMRGGRTPTENTPHLPVHPGDSLAQLPAVVQASAAVAEVPQRRGHAVDGARAIHQRVVHGLHQRLVDVTLELVPVVGAHTRAPPTRTRYMPTAAAQPQQRSVAYQLRHPIGGVHP